ncbi:MAG: glycerophosphodiester phosphodiesterase family protein [Xanthobacteraceae bacterium]
MTRLDWLTIRPIAHRGLHNPALGVIENTASAVTAAIDAGFGIEVDLQLSADAEIMVFHDATLDRLTEASGPLRDFTARTLGQIAFVATSDRMMRLDDLLTLVGGRRPLVLELKSRWDGDVSLATRTAAVLRGYAGPAAVMSFDPALVAAMARTLPGMARGLVIRRRAPSHAANGGPRAGLPALILHGARARPHFMAWRLQDLASAPAVAARRLLGLPLLTWTVRSAAEHRFALRHADQVIFENFRPLMNGKA